VNASELANLLRRGDSSIGAADYTMPTFGDLVGSSTIVAGQVFKEELAWFGSIGSAFVTVVEKAAKYEYGV
jgi:hypothetical protein